MHGHTDIQLARSDQDIVTQSFTADHEHQHNKTEDLAADLSTSHACLSAVAGNLDTGIHKGQDTIHLLERNKGLTDNETTLSKIDHEHNCIHLQSHSNQADLPTIFEETPSPERYMVSASESASTMNIDDSETRPVVSSEEPLLSRERGASLPLNESKTNSDDPLHTELDSTSPADEDRIQQDSDYPCEDIPSSLPSSSPPQLLSSSPYASSQSSISGIEPSKLQEIEVANYTSSPNSVPSSGVVPTFQSELAFGPKDIHDVGATEVAMSPETRNSCSQVASILYIDDVSAPSKKRTACQNDSDEPHRSPPTKNLKADPCVYLPPTPKRATLVSQHRQYKKLASPFRPPTKLPVATNKLAQATDKREGVTTVSAALDPTHGKVDTKGSITHVPLWNKTSNTSRSVAQFKSPLLNGALPMESRAIRPTLALQTLERKLQLLKRAIKVKEKKEEEVLERLVQKWVEAGREVAYDLWDATKESSDFEAKAKATSTCKSYGWERIDNSNTSWGWDTKSGDIGKEPRDYDPSRAPHVVGRPDLEEDEQDYHNTLGIMLRQLGIAPEIFGWDDDKDTFCD